MELYSNLSLFAGQPVIRLLEVQIVPRAHEELALEGSLTTHDLRIHPEYEALSYAWGVKDNSAHITLNGKPFNVSQTLFAALYQICAGGSNTSTARKLWVDAICINQTDNAEKSHQVMFMTDIYAKASRVIAWIGLHDTLTELAFDTLKRFAALDGTSNGIATYRRLQKTRMERGVAIDRLLRRAYFARIWIVQEVVVGRNVTLLCGPHEINFDRILGAINRMTGSGFYSFSQSIASLSYICSWRDSLLGRDSFASEQYLDVRLFEDSRNRRATDPRDKLYALRGIVDDPLRAHIDVNYDHSIEKVYTDFAKTVLKHQCDLKILSAVYLRHREVSKLDLPSYVPDWSFPKSGGGFLQRYYRFEPKHLFRASGDSVPKVSFPEGTSVIRIEGSRFDSITRVIPMRTLLGAEKGGFVSLSEDILKGLTEIALGSRVYGPTEEPSWIAFFRTLTADRTALSPRINARYWSQYFAGFAEWGVDHSHGELHDLPPAAWDLVSKDLRAIIEDKVIFVTAQGYLGLGHEGISEGDLVCILSGGEIPYLLRDSVGAGEEFEFLCECYVHGIMDGEAVAQPGERVWEEFSIA